MQDHCKDRAKKLIGNVREEVCILNIPRESKKSIGDWLDEIEKLTCK